MAITARDRSGVEADYRALRHAAGLSQQRVAELADCSLAAVALYGRGYRPERSEVLPRIAAVLNDQSPAGKRGSGETISGVGVAGHVRSG
jgi:transcriptional regulator with XRE-family HTH domain